MSTELLAWLFAATAATTVATLAVLALRAPLQRWLGAEIACRLWWVVPLAAVAAAFSLPRFAPVAHGAVTGAVATTPSVMVNVAATVRGLGSDRFLLAVWLLGAGALLTWLIVQQRRFIAGLRLRRGEDGIWRADARDASPAVVGLLRPRLVLPATFERDYSAEEQRLVLAHERMHQRRRDPWALAVCALLRTLFWFNPVVQAAAGRFRRDIELACDAAVLRSQPHSRQRYATALLKTHLATDALPVGCRWHPVPPLKERIMLLAHTPPSGRARIAGAILIALAATGATGFALAAHDAAQPAAAALAGSYGAQAPFYQVALEMSVGGKPIAHPTVIARPGDEASVRVDDHGRPWGLTFRIAPAASGTGSAVRLVGAVFSGDEHHVIGRPELGMALGRQGVIELNDPHGTATQPVYRIAATVTPAPAAPSAPTTPPAPAAPMTPTLAAAPAPPAPPGVPVPPPAGASVLVPPPPPPVPAVAAPAPPPPTARVEVERVMSAPAGTAVPVAGGRRVDVEVQVRHRDGGSMPAPPAPPARPVPPASAAPPAPGVIEEERVIDRTENAAPAAPSALPAPAAPPAATPAAPPTH